MIACLPGSASASTAMLPAQLSACCSACRWVFDITQCSRELRVTLCWACREPVQ